MKKLITILLLSIFFISCSKEQEKPSYEVSSDQKVVYVSQNNHSYFMDYLLFQSLMRQGGMSTVNNYYSENKNYIDRSQNSYTSYNKQRIERVKSLDNAKKFKIFKSSVNPKQNSTVGLKTTPIKQSKPSYTYRPITRVTKISTRTR